MTEILRRPTEAAILRVVDDHPLALACLLAALVQAVDGVVGVVAVFAGGLADADCYSRLARVLQLHQSGAWWERLDLRINAPYGEALQWTRPLDLLLELGAEPLGLLMPYEKALFLWGALISPLLLLATLAMLWWGCKRRLGPRGFLVMATLMQVSPSLVGTYLLGRPDHHSLLALLFLTQIVLLLRSLDGAGPRDSAVNGAVGGLALWVSLEAAVPQAYFGAALVGLWLFGRIELRHIQAYAVGLFVAVAIAIAIEFPPSLWLVPAYDRISVAQAGLLALTAILWLAIGPLRPEGGGRWWAAAGCGVILAAAVVGVTPKLLAGPFVDHGAVARAWLSEVAEWQPLWPTSRGRAADMFNELGASLVVVPWLVATRRQPRSLILLAGVLLFDAAAFSAVRWASYAQAMLLLPWTELVLAVWARRDLALRRPLALSMVAVGFLLGLLCGPMPAPRGSEAFCPVTPLAGELQASLVAPSGRRPVLLTYLFIGPELEWRTGLDLVGIPSANEATIDDTQTVFGGDDDGAARTVLAQRGVDYLLICPSSNMADEFRRPAGNSLHQRLEKGAMPPWLTPVALSPQSGGFRLFRVLSTR